MKISTDWSAGIPHRNFRDLAGNSAGVSCWVIEFFTDCKRYSKVLYIQFFGSSEGILFEKTYAKFGINCIGNFGLGNDRAQQ